MSNTPSALTGATTVHTPRVIGPATVVHNVAVCREHHRLTLAVAQFPDACPGQFVQLSPASPTDDPSGPMAINATPIPMLPRAFSIGGLRRTATACEVDVVYRVVGVATQWMATLTPGQPVTVLGPLGHAFPICPTKSLALLVIGGVGLPPLLWFADALHRAGRRAVAFVGAQTAELIPLDRANRPAPADDASEARLCAAEFAASATPMILSTDDGTCGFHGNVVQALAAHVQAAGLAPADCVAYTCGPERMMQATAAYCLAHSIECYVCLERPMACGVGTCQSCIVTVKAEQAAGGRRYALCCSEGPVFPAERIIWDHAGH